MDQSAPSPVPDTAPCETDRLVPRLPEFERPPDPALTAQGWERRFMADSARIKEYTELYASLGYEIRTEVVRPEEIGPDCNDCRLLMCRQFLTLYTRKP